MAEPDELKKETVRIDLPAFTGGNPPETDITPCETVRVQLPLRPPAAEPAAQMVVSSKSFSPSNSPRVSMPGIAAADALRAGRSAAATATEKSSTLWWIVLGLSALILIIQIWTYCL
jgi:hypothetical protein